MISNPPQASLLQRRIYGTLGLSVLVALYLLVGLTGHDPWRGDDARYFGPIHSILQGEGWLFPRIAGEPFPDFPPLYYWTAALLATAFKFLLPVHDGARLASALFTALAIYWIARAAERLHGRPARTPAAMLMLGSLGLVLHAHETQPMIALMAMQALVLAGLARAPQQPLVGGVQAGVGGMLAVLAGGLTGALLTIPLFPLALALSPDCRNPRTSGGLLIGLSLALGLGALWPIAVHLTTPEIFSLWLREEWQQLTAGALAFDDIHRLLELLGWSTWPLWPIALWGLWRGRRQITRLHWMLPLSAVLLTALWLYLSGDLSPTAALPLIPPVALLAAGGAPTLRRGAANAFDWFAVMTFAVFAILIWIAWTAQAFTWPPGLARHIAKVTPNFVLHGGLTQALIAGTICVTWFVLVWRLPRTSSRGPANWALGMTMIWCLAVVLLMPWFDYGRSYRPVARSLAQALNRQADECIATTGLPDAVRSSLDYYAGIRSSLIRGDSTTCRLLLMYEDRRPSGQKPAPEWQSIWEYRRGGGKQLETFRLYRRQPS
ncbi:hypothetical protein CJ010_09355 [Azoarcus sp. DD4]|uniref:ArnT family glycosyltransferase n=1 Tax=Azoarcus sp. DD4 TaxID=2027405 RepID=UPI00112B4054|nr:glycosyltransferase family 39 protein [Azoarcus sp. DD4]QDF96719.1 hypothetical protein CJ010_09355 [Azoarcus sp. DD4]